LEGGRTLWQFAWRRLRRDYVSLFALGAVLLLALLALLAPLITQSLELSYSKTTRDTYLAPLSPGHLLGTDDLGRDQFARLLYGGRVSLGIAFASATISLTIGVLLGLMAGYYQGGPLKWLDDALIWFITTLNSIPSLYLLIILAAVLNNSVGGAGSNFSLSALSLVLILSFLGWTGTMRLVRGETISQKNREYIIAARASGAGPLRIMLVHILPNIFSVIIITLALDISGLILTESALSYLGLGVQEPTPSWGGMLSDAQAFFDPDKLPLLLIPGGLITFTVWCFYIIGDGLRDAFDPQSLGK
jgi:peptide/nickel transport system permease protein